MQYYKLLTEIATRKSHSKTHYLLVPQNLIPKCNSIMEDIAKYHTHSSITKYCWFWDDMLWTKEEAHTINLSAIQFDGVECHMVESIIEPPSYTPIENLRLCDYIEEDGDTFSIHPALERKDENE
jgi:hypothetical protein